MVFVLSTICGE